MIRTLALASALAAAPLAAQSIVTVDDDPGADHATIQAAIDAASPLDLILVAPGDYDGFAVTAARTIVALDDDVAVSGTVRVFDLGSPERVVIRGVRQVSADGDSAGLVRSGNGTLWVEDCRFVGEAAAHCVGPAAGFSLLVGSTLLGDGVDPFFQDGPFPGLRVDEALVFAVDTVALGGPGETDAFNPGVGGRGARVTGGALLAQGGRLEGGQGPDGLLAGGVFCDFAFGGTGLFARDGALVELVDCPPTGGAPGDVCSLPGAASELLDTATLVEHPGAIATLDVDAVLEAGDTAQLTIAGPAGAGLTLLVGADTGPVFLPKFGSSLVVAPAIPPIPFGTLPPSGETTVTFTVPSLPTGVPFQSVFVQVARHDGGRTTLGDASFVTLVPAVP